MKGSFRISSSAKLDCEVLVIGSGAGGAAVADVMTRAGHDVLMLEEGAFMPSSETTPRISDSLQRAWRCGGLTPALGKPPVVYAEGCGVGGGTEINSAIFQRPDPALLDAWAETYGIGDFGAKALTGYLDRAAAVVNASETTGDPGTPSALLRDGAEALGWRTAKLTRGQRDCVGANACSTGCPTGGKQSMSMTLLPAAVARGLRLVANCRVERITRSGRVATGAVARALDGAGQAHRVRIRARAVIVCAGAIHTPALLQRSGFSRRFGATLRMHPTIRAIALFNHCIDAHLHRLPLYAVTEFMPDQRLGGSVFSPSFYAMALAEDWTRRVALLPDWRNAGMYYGMIRPRGTGRVIATPFGHEPLVTWRHAPEDYAALHEVTGRLAQAMFAAGARRVLPSVTGHPGWSDPGAAQAETRAGLPPAQTNLMTIHLFSSCPPGEKPDLAVTDSHGRVRGMENLLIADASQIPEAPGCNPQGLVMAMAFRAAEAFCATGATARRRAAMREA